MQYLEGVSNLIKNSRHECVLCEFERTIFCNVEFVSLVWAYYFCLNGWVGGSNLWGLYSDEWYCIHDKCNFILGMRCLPFPS